MYRKKYLTCFNRERIFLAKFIFLEVSTVNLCFFFTYHKYGKDNLLMIILFFWESFQLWICFFCPFFSNVTIIVEIFFLWGEYEIGLFPKISRVTVFFFSLVDTFAYANPVSQCTRILFRESCFAYLVSRILLCVSYFAYLASRILLRVSCFLYLASCICVSTYPRIGVSCLAYQLKITSCIS